MHDLALHDRGFDRDGGVRARRRSRTVGLDPRTQRRGPSLRPRGHTPIDRRRPEPGRGRLAFPAMDRGSDATLRVVLDARPALDPRRTGVGHYAWRLAHHLPPVDPDSSYVAWYLHARGLLHPRSFFA